MPGTFHSGLEEGAAAVGASIVAVLLVESRPVHLE